MVIAETTTMILRSVARWVFGCVAELAPYNDKEPQKVVNVGIHDASI